MDKLLVSVTEAAELLNIGRSAVYDLMRTGVLSSVRIGHSRRIPVATLRAYIADLEAEPWSAGSCVYRRGA